MNLLLGRKEESRPTSSFLFHARSYQLFKATFAIFISLFCPICAYHHSKHFQLTLARFSRGSSALCDCCGGVQQPDENLWRVPGPRSARGAAALGARPGAAGPHRKPRSQPRFNFADLNIDSGHSGRPPFQGVLNEAKIGAVQRGINYKEKIW